MNHEQIWERYVQSWKVGAAAERRAIFVQCLSPECVYADPLVSCCGWETLEAYMVDFHRQVPGGHFVTRHFQAHHERSIATWDMVGGDGTVLGDGMSYGEYDPEGRLTRMIGFFEVPDRG